MKVLYGDDQRTDLSTLQNDLPDCLDYSVFNSFGACSLPVDTGFPYTEKLTRVAGTTQLGRQFAPLLQQVVDLVLGHVEAERSVWERLETAFEMICCYDVSADCRRLDDACAQAMVEAGVPRAWVEADYDNIGELLSGALGPVP